MSFHTQTFVFALFSVGLSVAAQFALKAGMSSDSVRQALAGEAGLRAAWLVGTQIHVVLGLGLYVLGAAVWLAVLSRWDVSKAYPLIGIGFALSTLVGYLLGEQVTSIRLAGVACICAGVVLVARS